MTDAPPVLGLHHVAYRCRDAEETRRFYEEVLGLELAAALAFDTDPAGGPLRYLHIFFRMGDGRYVAFFDLPDHARPDLFRNLSGFTRHLALEVADEPALLAGKARLEANGYKVDGPIDHGFVRSVYTWDPNGIQVELTCRTATHDSFLAEEQQAARRTIEAWQQRPAEALA